MRKEVRIILIILLLGVFCVFGLRALKIDRRYRESREVYSDAASSYTEVSKPEVTATEPPAVNENTDQTEDTETLVQPVTDGNSAVPIKVDFDTLTRENPDVWGWIYCEGTPINYPVVFGRDNDYYLERNFRQKYDPSGSIFSDGANTKGVVNSNIILYGHHMLDGSMFASLKNWFQQDYYDAHPVMWLLTPEQNYRVVLFAAYPTSADSWTYAIYLGPSAQFDSYLQVAKSSSAFSSDVTLEPDAHYVVLSTCAYDGDEYGELRTVLHGKLVPVPKS